MIMEQFEYHYKIKFFDRSGSYMDTEYVDVESSDGDDARMVADDFAEEHQELIGSYEYEITLEDVC